MKLRSFLAVGFSALAFTIACDSAENRAETRQDVSEARQEGAEEIREARREAGEQRAEAQRDVREEMREGGDVGEATQEAAEETAQAQYDVTISQLEAEHRVAIQKCEGLAGDAQEQCKRDADAKLETGRQHARTMLEGQTD
ncbi:MAG: hypothetical protein DCC71_13155 [Proteobacteria bacterium]|nr:MAG: hypothetical protein DCC71_13155 [Pseudomonadota bacterium]